MAFAGYAADNDGKVPLSGGEGMPPGYAILSAQCRELPLVPSAVRHESDEPAFGHGKEYLAWYQRPPRSSGARVSYPCRQLRLQLMGVSWQDRRHGFMEILHRGPCLLRFFCPLEVEL